MMMLDGWLVIFLFVIMLVIVVFCYFGLFKILWSDEKRCIGEITVNQNENGAYVWDFNFYDEVTYDAIVNMKEVTFKIKKGDIKDAVPREK